MTTIYAAGRTPKDAPAPDVRSEWTADWGTGGLRHLTAWVASNGGTEYSCTTASSLAETKSIAGGDLKNWISEDPVNRSYGITD